MYSFIMFFCSRKIKQNATVPSFTALSSFCSHPSSFRRYPTTSAMNHYFHINMHSLHMNKHCIIHKCTLKQVYPPGTPIGTGISLALVKYVHYGQHNDYIICRIMCCNSAKIILVAEFGVMPGPCCLWGPKSPFVT